VTAELSENIRWIQCFSSIAVATPAAAAAGTGLIRVRISAIGGGDLLLNGLDVRANMKANM
jgi:hypothetical protein